MIEPNPQEWPVLVTGAGGFVGGHVARMLARAGHQVRGLVRKLPTEEPGDPKIEWHVGDLLDVDSLKSAVRGVRGVIHVAACVNLGFDPNGTSQRINVEGTRLILKAAIEAGVERFVHTSTLWTLAAGTAEHPADEDTAWNLDTIRSPYVRTKREAEQLVLEGDKGKISTVALCPGMVVGPRDPKLTSSILLILLAKCPIAGLPGGGLPLIDVQVLAQAHCRALVAGGTGHRYAVIGPYCSFLDLARMVRTIVGKPVRVGQLPAFLQRPYTTIAGLADRLVFRGTQPAVTAASVAGGYLKLYVTGARADQVFGLEHPSQPDTIREALEDLAKRGRLQPFP